jgi:endoglucanase
MSGLGVGSALVALGLALAYPAAAEAPPDTATPAIVIDQFGYPPDQPKVAVLREPVMGFDAPRPYAPGAVLQVVEEGSGRVVLSGPPVAWSGGAVDPSSGDRAWWFDFSSLRTPGRYRIVDPERHESSAPFRVASDVYRPVLVQAVRMLFYQRAGFAKEARYAGAKWADGASHMGPLQDTHARAWSAPGDASTERDLHGGWFDAGDFNRYAGWAGHDIVELLNAYRERPEIWGDDYGLPESGDGVPDLLNEVKWELDWLERMQNPDGSVLAELAAEPASPPSSAKGQSLWCPPTSFATTSAAAAFALAAKVYASADPRFSAYARDLAERAARAWTWARAHPDVVFREKSAGNGIRLAADLTDASDADRVADRLATAAYLFDLTGEAQYRDYVDAHLADATAGMFPTAAALLTYAAAPGATPEVASRIRRTFLDQTAAQAASAHDRDPYRAYLPGYWWGSNRTKSETGLLYAERAALEGEAPAASADTATAAGYIHYLHGVNPLGKVYLSNMGAFGAANSVDSFFHSWFAEGSPWGSVSASPNGPPPGYLVGGPNPHYGWDPRCPGISPACGAAPPSPPAGQPPQKSYKDFATSWPIDSWEVTEADLLYQASYIRLLSKYVR